MLKKRRALDSNQRIPYDIGSLANCWFKPLTQPSLNHLFCKREVQIYYLFWYLQNFTDIFYSLHHFSLPQLAEHLPHKHARRHRNVERVLDANLRNFDCAIDNVCNRLIYAIYLIAKD